MQKTYLTLILCAGLLGGIGPAQSQNEPSNMRNFYMARQQITITDDAPMVDDRRTFPQPGGGGGGAGVGGMGGGRMPLPKAGWQPWSADIPGVRTALPKVVNGVPPKAPPPGPSGMSGKAGALKAKPKAAKAPPPISNTAQSYSAYKGYGGSLSPSSASGYGSGGGGMSSKTAVQGSVLHWARRKQH